MEKLCIHVSWFSGKSTDQKIWVGSECYKFRRAGIPVKFEAGNKDWALESTLETGQPERDMDRIGFILLGDVRHMQLLEWRQTRMLVCRSQKKSPVTGTQFSPDVKIRNIQRPKYKILKNILYKVKKFEFH